MRKLTEHISAQKERDGYWVIFDRNTNTRIGVVLGGNSRFIAERGNRHVGSATTLTGAANLLLD